MKRPHRRIHFLFWLFIAPITAVAGFLFWQMRPATPFTDLPPGIEAISETTSDASETH